MWLLRTLSLQLSDPNLADRLVHIDRDLVCEPRPPWDAASLLGLIPSLPVQFSLYFSLVRELICSHLHSDVNGVTRRKQGSDPHMLLRKHAGTLHTLWPDTTNTHSPCMTDGTCQDAKTQPPVPASLEWPSAHGESSEWAIGWLSHFSLVLRSGVFLPAAHRQLGENRMTQTKTAPTTGRPQSIRLSRITKSKKEGRVAITNEPSEKAEDGRVWTDKWVDCCSCLHVHAIRTKTGA